MGRFVEVVFMVKTGPALTSLRLDSLMVAMAGSWPDDITGITSTTGGFNPVFPNDSGTRGTYLGNVLAKALSLECPILTSPTPSQTDADRQYTPRTP